MRHFSLCCAALSAAAITLAEPASAARYVFATFKGDRAPGEKLSIYQSSDALNFTVLSDTGFTGSSGTLRDPSIMKYRYGKYYVAHTNPPTESCCGREDHFSIATSTDLLTWTELITVAAPVPGVDHVWAPEWFIDDGVVHVIASIDTLDNDSDFKPYLFTATNAELSAWTAPVPLGFGPNYIDTFVLKVAGVYHAFTKQENTRLLEHATAPALTGPWTFIGVGNWSGFGAGMEGPNLIRLDDGRWRIFLDGQGSVGFLHAESTDLLTWSATQPLPGISDLVRHGTIILDAVDDSLLEGPDNPGPVLRDAGAPGTAGSDAGRPAGSPDEPAPPRPISGVRDDSSAAQSGEASSAVAPLAGNMPTASGSSEGASPASAPTPRSGSDPGCSFALPASPLRRSGGAVLLACAAWLRAARLQRRRLTPAAR